MAAVRHRPKACPFCGEELEEYMIPLPRYPFAIRGWRHPVANCFASGFEVEPADVGLWNRRARV